MTLWGQGSSDKSCPIFVGGVGKDSPAAQAGVKQGDQLLTVDGASVADLQSTSKLRSTTAGPVVIKMARNGGDYSVSIQRQEYSEVLLRQGLKAVNGLLMDLTATDTEVQWVIAEGKDLDKAFANRDASVIFADHHYPLDKQLYYPGFEAFVWDGRKKLTVGGMEDGPARRSGVRWGDIIIGVKGLDLIGKSDAEIERLLSSSKPIPMVLRVNRAGVLKTFSFELEQATTILRVNHWQVVEGKIIPLWAPQKYWHCF